MFAEELGQAPVGDTAIHQRFEVRVLQRVIVEGKDTDRARFQRVKNPFQRVQRGRSGPDHAARFTVRVSVKNVGDAEATANSKQEAETAAAKAFMEQYG